MSQMATTAPGNDHDFASGGRITADLKVPNVLNSKQANQKLADQALTPALFAKKNQQAHQNPANTGDGNVFQKRSVSVYQKPNALGDTF